MSTSMMFNCCLLSLVRCIQVNNCVVDLTTLPQLAVELRCYES